jgi:hypothetical protein
LSTYNKCFLGTSGQELRAVLAAAQGERLVVEKTRHLFMVGQTRIHIDEVKGLGSFMELEVIFILISYFKWHNGYSMKIFKTNVGIHFKFKGWSY